MEPKSFCSFHYPHFGSKSSGMLDHPFAIREAPEATLYQQISNSEVRYAHGLVVLLSVYGNTPLTQPPVSHSMLQNL